MIIFIPVRLNSVRLPKKVVADIKGLPMMIQVGMRAKEAEIGEVVFACAENELVEIAQQHGFKAVLTDPSLATGTDRIYAAYKSLRTKEKYIMNLQGDMPFINPKTIKATSKIIFETSSADISTAANIQTDDDILASSGVVKIAITHKNKALYFSRSHPFPYGEGTFYQHHGIYAYTSEALEMFVSLPRSKLEIRENLEQLRALENDMNIFVAIVDDCPQSVDLPQDLAIVRS